MNYNFDEIREAFDRTLSRDGSGPNYMEAPLDMNDQQIINLPAPTTPNSPARLRDLVDVSVELIGPEIIQDAIDAAEVVANEVAQDRALKTGANINPVTEAPQFNSILEIYRRPFEKPLMDFVTDINATDWKPFFDAAVDWAANNAPSGVRFTLPRYVVAGGIPLSFVKPILSDDVHFVGKGSCVWTGTYLAGTDPCDISLLPSGGLSVFKWGNNNYDPAVPGGFTQRGGGLSGLNIRGWLSDAFVIDTHGVVNPKFQDIWMWVPFNAIRIRNGSDPLLTDIHVEAYRNIGVVINGTGEGTGPAYQAGRGDRGFARNVLVVGAGDEVGPTAPNPAFAVRGYWHTFDGEAVRIVKGGGAQALWIGDRRNGNSVMRPSFITFNNTQIDFVANRCIEVDDAEAVWFNGALYMNSSPLEQIRVGANAYNVHFKNPKGYASESRMVTIGGTLVTIMGGNFTRWDSDGVSTEPCIYYEATATDVKIVGTTFGDPTSGTDTSAGKRAIYAPPEAVGSLSVVGCGFYDLATIPVERGNTRFNSAGCVDQFGPAKLPMGASRLFLGSQDYLPGSHALYAVGDLAMAYGGATTFFNSYYDGANFRRSEATAAGYIKNESTGISVWATPTGTAGATFSANVVARFNSDGTFRVTNRIGVGREPVAGNSVIVTSGDISIGGGVPTTCFNLYFDGGWKYLGNGAGAILRLNTTTGAIETFTAPNNVSGPGATATLTQKTSIAV